MDSGFLAKLYFKLNPTPKRKPIWSASQKIYISKFFYPA